MRNVKRTFTKDGKRYYVPSDSYWAWSESSCHVPDDKSGQTIWSELSRRILKRWHPHSSFKTLLPKAHVAALRPHLAHRWFAVIDLLDFYDHVTRTKIHRALQNIGFARKDAFRIAGESTVQQGEAHSLPRGFRQSPMLATLVLEQSLFGSFLRQQLPQSTVTVFSDDIVISSDNFFEVQNDFVCILDLLERSRFPAHPQKTQEPRLEVIVFNIHMSSGSLAFKDERMWQFTTKAAKLLASIPHEMKTEFYDQCFGDYVASINAAQAMQLRASVGIR